MEAISLELGLEDTHVVVTGGAGMIGSAVVSAFLAAGARISVFDINEGAIERLREAITTFQSRSVDRCYFHKTDVSSEDSVRSAFEQAEKTFGPVQTCIALASLDLSVLCHPGSIADMESAQWRRTFDVNVHGTFLTAKEWLRRLRDVRSSQANNQALGNFRNISLIIIGSESGIFGVTGNPDYAAGKSAVQSGLLQSLKTDAPRIWPGARVNAVAPGPVDTPQFRCECREDASLYYAEAQATVPLGRPVSVNSVARAVIFLASQNWSADINGQVISVDGGKSGRLEWTEQQAAQLPKTF